MKPSLQLRLSQSLTMTPQLQQAIRLLQLSNLELCSEIQDALESNMMLELDEEEAEPVAIPSQEPKPGTEAEQEAAAAMDSDDIPEDLPVDTAWEDLYDGGTGTGPHAPSGDYSAFEQRDARENTLREHLLWQLNVTPLSDTDRAVAGAVIDALDEDGYLGCTLEEIRQTLPPGLEVEEDEIEANVHLVQSMEPAGVAARNLRECLTLQLAQLPPDTPWLEPAQQVVTQHLDLLGAHDYNQLLRRLKMKREELQQVVALIQSLNPKPGTRVQQQPTEYIAPDVYVRKEKGAWKVELNRDVVPQLRINNSYASMIRRADNSTDNASLKTHLQEARWFIKSLQSRSETLLRVAGCIVERQRAFLEYGEEAMKPLVLHDVAEALGMHESTISRVTTRKYMHTPRGIFELKYFFSSHVATEYGGACSSTAIRALIKKMVGAEKAERPLSDSKLAELLADQGIKVARRTVAKYRESMAIPPSSERRRLA